MAAEAYSWCRPAERTAEALEEAVASIDPGNSFCLQPRDGVTECNEAARFICAVLGRRLPRAKANQQRDWLASREGVAAGWMPVDAETARARAETGYPTLAVWKNPTGGHGHIALLVPAPDDAQGEAFLAQAGEVCSNRIALQHVFGLGIVDQVEYFTAE